MQKKTEDLNIYKEELLMEKEQLKAEIASLEEANFQLQRQIKELELQLLQKNKVVKELSSGHHDVKKQLVQFVTEESNLKSEIDLLETEKGRIIASYNIMSNECGENISSLGSTILKIDFIKGEIETLRQKIRMSEEDAEERFGELDSLEEKFNWASKSFRELTDSMKKMEKEMKIKFYTKE